MGSSEPPPTTLQPRVFHLDDGHLWRGGQHQVWLLLNELAGMGIPQCLIAREGCPLTVRARQIGIDVRTLNFRGELDLIGPHKVAAMARSFGANIIHAHTGHAHAFGRRVIRRLKGQAQLLTTRRVDFPVSNNFFSARKYTDANQHFIAISKGVRQVLIDGGVAPDRIDVVNSGVPGLAADEQWTREDVRQSLGIGAEETAILNIGALTDHKGQRWLIEAAPDILARHPNARIHILGEGELKAALSEQIRQLGLEGRIVLHGYVEDARLKLSGFDLFVSSSHLEGLGTVNLDAMLAGLPVVAAAAGGVPEIVLDGQTGRLVPSRNGRALAEAINETLDDPQHNQPMIEAAKRHVEENFSAASMAEGTLAIYHKILAAEPVNA